jgi:hypothetical protein
MKIYQYAKKSKNKNFPGTFCLLSFLLLAFFVVVLISATPSPGQKSQETDTESELLTNVDEVFKEVSQIRDLEIKYPIRKGFKSQAELRDFVLKKLEEEYTDPEIAAETKAMVKWGLFPKDIQLKELLVNLLAEQVAGLYDPKEKIFYISNWIPGFLQKPIMAHELTHALQDQYFDLDQFLRRVKDNDDEVLARTALIEGEALAVMIEYLLKPQGLDFSTLTDLIPRLKNQVSILGGDLGEEGQIPEIIKETLLFPYLQGISFVQTFRKSHPWKDFSQIYADPPASSEQILHPEKYFDARDRPIPITLENFSDLLPKDWKEIYTNVLGELGISILIKKFAGEEMAKLAAEGWGGDRYKLLEDPNTGNLLLIHFSTWDSPKDAMEFFLAYRQVVENKYTSAQLLQSEKRRYYLWSTGEGEVYLEVKGTDVLVIEGASEDLVPAIQKRLWGSRKG